MSTSMKDLRDRVWSRFEYSEVMLDRLTIDSIVDAVLEEAVSAGLVAYVAKSEELPPPSPRRAAPARTPYMRGPRRRR